MLIFRWILLLLLAAGLVCFAMYLGTGQARYKVFGVRVVKVAVITGLGFFAVLILERMAVAL